MKLTFATALIGTGLLITACDKKEVKNAKASEMNEARDIVMASIQAHGGKEKWYGNGQLQFRWTYHMTDRGPQAIVDTKQTVDPKTMAVTHEVIGKDIRLGMSDGKAWITPKGSEFMPPARFWALTPFYFIGIPFVFNDSGANFEKLDAMMAFEGKDYTQVKITYSKDSGDSPDDYYVLLIDPETKLTKGAYYTVTSELVTKGKVGPAKFISLDNLADVDGVMLATGHRTFKMTEGKIGEQMRYTDVKGVKFLPRGTVDLSIPEGAEEL